MKAFTKEAAEFKIAAFCADQGIKDTGKAYDELVGSMGYDKFLESSPGQLKKAYAKLYPKKEPKKEKKEKKE